ncbi:DHA1 family bicyclomycin/chloramphenicol resistance-like MFS transporter [Symbiobacterium terraclitae]|uniref:Bcr/CflA family efflux transporter n=1 Tax=Symbiobacterium terraclitae TaxID=557451 RepID=A0ABS4JU42_9FIRM|nr:DHA1 family bicyclomycin/chloramphenicol resistance-like MFS transporter [Symbiobacterium terraclitae]
MNDSLPVEQRYLRKAGLVMLITVLNMTAPLSTDMYLPSFPTMMAYFGVQASVLNLTLVGFFFFFAVGMLLFGPFSDRFGRKPVLVAGLGVYIAACLLCAGATSVWQLILFRILQALGAGCMVSVSTALVKDCFSGRLRGTILATIQSMSVVAPMLAPVIGALIVQYASWRTTFLVLSGISLLSLTAALFLQEPLRPEARLRGGVWSSLARLFVVARNRSFIRFLAIVGLIPTGFMAYIAVSSYIYIDFFGLSESAYSFFFATNAAISVLGPLTYIRINGRVAPRKLITAGLSLTLGGGLAVLLAGRLAPLAFLLSFMPFTFGSSLMRPIATDILLNQQETDTGSAASLINFGNTVMGSLGMVLGTLPWPTFVTGLGTIAAGASLIALAGWFLLLRSDVPLSGVKPGPRPAAVPASSGSGAR